MAHYLDKPDGGFTSAPAPECSDCPEVEGRLGYNCFTPNYEVIGARSCSNVFLQSIPAEVQKRKNLKLKVVKSD